jgi:hypothetical protein
MNKNDANRDPISGKPGAHPVGVGAGAAAGGAAGAAIGSAVGPAGTVVGAAVGAVAGGLAGKKAAERVNPTVEDAYWKNQYTNEPYYEAGRKYNDYAPAYRTGYEGYTRYEGRTFDDVQSDLERDYNATKGDSALAWDKAKGATRAAWHRVENALPGDFDKDGR